MGMQSIRRRAAGLLGRTRRPVPVVLLALAIASAFGVVAAHQDGFSAQAVDLGSGSVWVPSNGPGQLALLDGASAEVTVKLKVANDGDDLLAVQAAGAGYAVNRTTGTVVRIDAATWNTSAPQELITGSTSELTAIATDRSLFAVDVDRGLVIRADPNTLQTNGSPRSLSARPGPGSPVIDNNGVFWLLDAIHGNLIRMTETPEVTETELSDGPHGRLVLANDRPVVVDLSAGTAMVIDPESGQTERKVCVDVDPTDRSSKVLGSSTADEVFVLSGAAGVLRITDLATGDCTATVADVATPGAELGQPIEAANRVFIPNYSTGQVIVVDLDTRTSVVTPPLVTPGTVFDLIGRDGFAFYNDRNSNQAGVVNTDGTTRPIAKYDVDDPGNGLFEPNGATDEQSADGITAATTAPTGNDPAPPVEEPADAAIAETAPFPVDGDDSGSIPTGTERNPDPATSQPTQRTITTPTTNTSTTVTPTTPTPTVPTTTTPAAPTAPTTTPTSVNTAEKSPIASPPVIDRIDISSKHGEPYLQSDTLTFSAATSGSTPTSWKWTLADLTHPGGQAQEISTEPTFSLRAESGGDSTEWKVTAIATSTAGPSESKSTTFQVGHTNDNPVTITDFHASAAGAANPNTGLVGQNIAFLVTTTGVPFSCEVIVTNAAGDNVGRTECNHADLTFDPGTYDAVATATPREGDPVTEPVAFTIYALPVLSIGFGGLGAGTVSDANGNDCSQTCTKQYGLGEVVTLAATGRDGATPAWTSCANTTGNNCAITMNGPQSVSVTFTPDSTPPSLTLTAGGTTATATTVGPALNFSGANSTVTVSAQANDPQGGVSNTSIRYFVDSVTCLSADRSLGRNSSGLSNGVGTELTGSSRDNAAALLNLSALSTCGGQFPVLSRLTLDVWATSTSRGGSVETKKIGMSYSP